MPTYCCVPGCKATGGGHTFPKDLAIQNKWRVAVRRVDRKTKNLWRPKPHDRVCSKHFRQDDYVDTLLGVKKILKPAAVPSVFDFDTNSSTPSTRDLRMSRRRLIMEQTTSIPDVPDVAQEVELCSENVNTLPSVSSPDGHQPQDQQAQDTGIQCEILNNATARETIQLYQNDNSAIQYLTGFSSYEHFELFFKALGPAVDHLNFKCNLIPPEDQCFLTLMKLRQAFDDVYLALRFKISKTTVSDIVTTWINFMYFQLKEIDIWPDREVIDQTMPSHFGKLFPKTRVILDATEVPIDKPSRVDDQSVTFSTYKNKNTLKTIIGCSPRGLVSYISASYGGSASDRQIIERSELCSTDMLEKGDSIMSDRGIMVQDIFAHKDVYVNTPAMLKGQSQLDAVTVVRDRRIASKRIHVERVIGLGKTYKILTRPLPHQKIALGGRIVTVCFLILNFRRCIVGKNA